MISFPRLAYILHCIDRYPYEFPSFRGICLKSKWRDILFGIISLSVFFCFASAHINNEIFILLAFHYWVSHLLTPLIRESHPSSPHVGLGWNNITYMDTNREISDPDLMHACWGKIWLGYPRLRTKLVHWVPPFVEPVLCVHQNQLIHIYIRKNGSLLALSNTGWKAFLHQSDVVI